MLWLGRPGPRGPGSARSNGVADHRGQVDGLPHARPRPASRAPRCRRGWPAPVAGRAGRRRRRAVPGRARSPGGRTGCRRSGRAGSPRAPVPRPGTRRRVAHELGDGVGVEPGQVEAAHAVEPVQVGEPGAELVRPVGRGGPEGAEHERGGAEAGVDHVLQQRDGRQLSPSAGRRGRRPAAGRGRVDRNSGATASNRSRRPSPAGRPGPGGGGRHAATACRAKGLPRAASSEPGSPVRNRWSSISTNGW